MLTFMVQARVGSTRLPNKILLPFYRGKCILELLIEKLRQVDNVQTIIATSIDPKNNAIEEIAKNYGVICFRGSENNVLQRFIDAANIAGTNELIRICSDRPFLELNSIKKLIDRITLQNKDYISFKVNGTPSIKTHYGFWTEYVTLNTLEKVKRMTINPLYYEHVTNFIYEHPQYFDIEWIEVPQAINEHPKIRLTTDTKDDFETVKSIYAELCEGNPYPTIEDILIYLDSHKEYYAAMLKQIDQNSK